MSVHQLVLNEILPGAPFTIRAVPTSLSAFGNVIAYGCKNNVVLRNLENSGDVIIFTHHTSLVTAVRISPQGRLVASGDQNGNLLVWLRRADTQEVLNTKQLQGPVRDIAWTNDEERLVVVGDGRTIFASVISITANTIGSINGHTQNILSCDMRGDRPYRIVTGGADSIVGFYEGVPFKFKCNVKGHTDKVTCVRYSPNMETIASVSRVCDVIFLCGITGERKSTMKTEHKGAIYAVAWSLNGSKLVTAGADKTVKIFNVADGTMVSSCFFGTNVTDMQQGVVYTSQGIISVSLGGELTLLGEDGCVRGLFLGHQGRILLVDTDSKGAMISVSVERALVWQGVEGAAGARAGRKLFMGFDVVISAAAFSNDTLYLVADNKLLRCSLTETDSTVILDEKFNVTDMAITANGIAVLLLKNSFVIVDTLSGCKIAEEKLDRFDGTCAAAHGNVVVLGGDKKVLGYCIAKCAPLAEMCVQFAGQHTGIVACVAFSHDGQRVASGDANRNIFVWSVIDGSVIYKDLVFHTLRVTSLVFSPNNNSLLLSGSMDTSLIVWDLDSMSRKREDAAHRGGVSAVAWTKDGYLLSGGSDCCVRRWSFSS